RENEDRDREARGRDRHDKLIRPAPRLPGSDNAERNADQNSEGDRRERQRNRRPQSLGHEVGDRHVGEERLAKVTRQNTPEPAKELNKQSLIEAEAAAY